MSTPEINCSRQDFKTELNHTSIIANSSLSIEPLIMDSKMAFSSPTETTHEGQSRSFSKKELLPDIAIAYKPTLAHSESIY